MSIKTLQSRIDRLRTKLEPAHKVGAPILFYDASMPGVEIWLESQGREYLVMLPQKKAALK